jgi:hypothetical protein
MQIWERNGVPTLGVTIDGVVFHDVTVDSGNDGTCGGTAGSGRHVDCVQILGGIDVTIRNSRFYNCATDDIIARPYEGAQLGPLTFENNMLAPVRFPGNTINIGNSASPFDPCTGPIVVRFNTMRSAGVNGGCSGTTVLIDSNILATGSCNSPFTYQYNVFPTSGSAQCGSGRRACAVAFAQSASSAADYHLAASDTCAKGGGNPSGGPADIDGQSRPQGAGVDAGADEIG